MDEPENQNSPSDNEVHPLDYLIILAKHSRLIIFVSAAVAVLTYLLMFILPNTYTATARLLPPQQNLTLSAQLLESLGSRVTPGAGGGGGGMGGGVGGMAASLLGLRSPGDMYVTMMTSNTVLDHIISRFDLMGFYKTKFLEDARKALRNDAKITSDKKDSILTIEATSTTPKLAAEIANAFIEELGRLLHDLGLQEAEGRLVFLEKERLQASQNLNKAEESVRLFSEKNSILQIDTQTRGAIEYIARLRAEIDAKEVSIAVLRQQATPFNYDVVRLETEVNGLKEKLRDAEAQKANCVSDVCLPTDKAPSLGLEYLRLFREAKFQESLYQLYTRLVEVARLDMVRDVAVVQMLDRASPPERRSNKRLPRTLMVGVFTFITMIFTVFITEYWGQARITEKESTRMEILYHYLDPWLHPVKNITSSVLHHKKTS